MSKKLGNLAFCACLLVLFFSCSSDQSEENEGNGTLRVHVSTNSDVFVGANTRIDDGMEEGIPDVNDFTFSLFKGETLRNEWATFAEFLADDEPTLRPGTYTATASYGNVGNEGFGSPYFEGNQSFAIVKGQTTEVELTCFLANAKLSIVYTDAFKDYFSTYFSEVVTSLGNTVKYISSEVRYAYFKPGDLRVRTTVKKKEGYTQEVTLQAKNFTAEARHAYILTLDVDAGTPTLKISFSDDIPNEKPITIEISDQALSAPPPYFKAKGFEVDQVMNVVEGKPALEPEVYAYLHAEAGITQCHLTTHSKTLIEQGWPETVDLANVSPDDWAKMEKLGLRMAGLGEKKDKIAKIDFTGVIPFLEYDELDADAKHVFELNATDVFFKVGEPLVFKVSSQDNQFALAATPSVLYGTTKVRAGLTLDGNPAKVTYWLKQTDGELQIMPSAIQSEGVNHQLVFKFNQSQYSDLEIEARYLRRAITTKSVMGDPVILSLEHPGDVWTKKATLQLIGALDGDWKFQCLQNGTWNPTDYTLSGSAIPLAGLPSNTELLYRFVCKDEEGDIIGASNQLNICTEEEKQVPNSGFEDWYAQETWSDGSLLGGMTLYAFFPYKDQEQWWCTRNLMTTRKLDGVYYSWYYATYPGTVPTNAGELNTGTWHLNKYDKKSFAIEPHNGKTAMEIATVGWGFNNWGPGGGSNPQQKTAGSLYVGTYDNASHSEVLGQRFDSRPTSVHFYYKYYSYNNEYTKPSVVVYAADGSRIGGGEFVINSTVDSYSEGRISIQYNDLTKKASSIVIAFLSTNVESPATKAVKGGKNVFSGYGDSRHIGSVLTVDDVTLEYAN